MVLLEFKKSERNAFLTELPFSTNIEVVLQHLIHLNNLRVKIDKLASMIEGLCEHGPLRPEGLRGLTMPETYEPAFDMLSKEEKDFMQMNMLPTQTVNPDPSGYRTGKGLNTQMKEKILETVKEARDLISVNNLQLKKQFSGKEAEEVLMLLKGAVMIAYPGYYGLPHWEPTCLMLEDKFNYLQYFPDCDWLDETNSTLWWAKKELLKGKILADYVGKNEKTKIIVKIMPKGKGAPLAEPPIDQETQKKMMSFYYKKQDESKKLEEENEDDYMNSEWANPTHLKNQLVNGGRGINMRPFR
jgi:hypothetical protein